jgi:hypothetical protein
MKSVPSIWCFGRMAPKISSAWMVGCVRVIEKVLSPATTDSGMMSS